MRIVSQPIKPDETTAFYEANAVSYAQRTAYLDLSYLHEPFLAMLPEKGGRILDVGCGSGRDLKAFRLRGHFPQGIDPSPAIAQLASAYSGCPVEIGTAQALAYVEEFDAVWACASLLHLRRSALAAALVRIRRSLVPAGVLFVSMQKGSGEEIDDDGRLFSRYSASELDSLIRSASFEIRNVWTTADALARHKSVEWINVLARAK